MAESAQQEDKQHPPEADEDRQSPETPPPDAQEEAEEPELPEADVDIADAGTLRKKVTVTIPRARIDAKFNEMFGELATTAQVPGFRIGRAPRRLIEKRFGKEVGDDVRNAMIGESLGGVLEKSELKTVGEPEIDLDKIELPETGDMEFSFEVEVAPEFDLPELSAIKVTRRTAEVTDEHVDSHLRELTEGRARFERTDEKTREGDVVTCGATISGEGIEPVERPGLTLRVAPGQIEGLPLVDLGKELSGKKAGQTVALKVTAPEAHPDEGWRGKELTVEVAVSEVRRRILPEVNDEFAETLGFESVQEMRQFVSGRLEQRLQAQAKRDMRGDICQHLLENTDFEVPAGAARRHTVRLVQRRYVELLSYGVPREKIDERLTELQAAASDQARQDLKLQFILDRVAKNEGIEVDDDEVNARVAQMAASQNRRPERLHQELAADGSLDQVRASVRDEKCIDLLLERAEMIEAEPETEEPDKPAKTVKKKKKAAKKTSAKAAGKTEKKAKKTGKTTAKKAAKKKASKGSAEKDADAGAS